MRMMILKRLFIAVPSLIGVVIVTFLLTRALPGDPAAYFAGPAATKEAVEQIRVKLAHDRAASGARDQDAAACFGRAHVARPHRLHADCRAARHSGGDAAELDSR